MKKTHLAVAAVAGLVSAMASQARATTVDVNFSGPGVSGALVLTYGAATDAKYPNAYEVTGISGTFSDSNNGLNILNAPIGSLVAITHATPDPTNSPCAKRFQQVRGGVGSARRKQWLPHLR